MKRVCTIEGCGKLRRKREWCGAHYQRWRKYGDPLKGETAKGEVQRFYRDVVLTYDGNECLLWPFSVDRKGYGQIRIDGRLQTVSNLVCREVHGEPPSPEHESTHSCDRGHEACVTKLHLEWKTHAENMADMVDRGRSNRGERHPLAKLTEADVRQIRALRGRMKGYAVADKFGINQGSVSAIQLGKLWRHVT